MQYTVITCIMSGDTACFAAVTFKWCFEQQQLLLSYTPDMSWVCVFFFFPFLSCLQCPQWKAQATGATSWRSAWRSTIQLTRLSTRTPELLFLRTTAAPHTTGELLQLRLRNLRSELWMREEVSHWQMHVCCSLSLLFCVLLSLQIKKTTSLSISLLVLEGGLILCCARVTWKIPSLVTMRSVSFCLPASPLLSFSLSWLMINAHLCRSSPESKVSDTMPKKSESVEVIGSEATSTDEPSDHKSST